MRKLRMKAKSENKKVLEKHETAIQIEQRYRNMKEIVRHKKRGDDQLERPVELSEVQQAEETYVTEVYHKEEELIQQQQDLREQ